MNLLYVKHPDPVVYKKQIDFLDNLNDPEKSERAQVIRIANASLQYYYKAEPTLEDFEDWLTGLPDGMKETMQKRGYQQCRLSYRLQRHALERQDIGMSAFIRPLLNDDDYEIWVQLDRI